MYSRVKRKRKTVKRDMYGMPIEGESSEEEDSDDSGDGKNMSLVTIKVLNFPSGHLKVWHPNFEQSGFRVKKCFQKMQIEWQTL